jgi:hypothetical protein
MERERRRRERRERWRQAWRSLEDHLEVYVAIVAGVVVGALGVAEVTSAEITSGTTLIVLAIVTDALRRDRTLRKELNERLSLVSRAFSSPLPYEVIDGHYTWDFEPGGRIARVRKRAHIRFVQNGVWTIVQWHIGKADVRDRRARRLLADDERELTILDGPVDPPDKTGKLIALDREWQQPQEMEIEYQFVSHNSFPDAQEWIKVDIETATASLTVDLLWAKDRRPEAVRLVRDGDPKPLPVNRHDGRWRTRLELQSLKRGDLVDVRWDWRSLADLEAANARTGVDDDG